MHLARGVAGAARRTVGASYRARFALAAGATLGIVPVPLESPIGEPAALEIGLSGNGRPIEITCFNSGPSIDDEVALIVGGIHTGNEAVTVDLAYELIGDFTAGLLVPPSDITVCILPELNPDGLALGLHTNAKRVDLNRNWPSHDWQPEAWHPETGPVSAGHVPLSEPETQVLHSFLEVARPSAVMVLHCCGSLVEANRHADAVFMARRYANATGYDYLGSWNFYDISGEFIDAMDELGIPAMDIELSRPDSTDLEAHRAGIRSALAYLSERPRR